MSVEFLCSRTKMMPVADLKPHPDNPWDHGKKQIAMLRAYIEIDGWRHPIIIDQDSGWIAGGHLRRLVAMDMGLQEVPVDIQKFKSPARLMAFLKADNEIGNLRKLDPEKDTLFKMKMAQLDPDLNVQLEGIGDFRLETNLLKDSQEPLDPVSAPVRTEPGKIYHLGSHVLGVGDATDGAFVKELFALSGALPTLMVTDPPYGVDYDPAWRTRVRRNDGSLVGALSVGEVKNDDRMDWREVYELFPGDVAYIWHASQFTSETHASIIAAGFDVLYQIIWVKQHFAIGRGDYHWQHEPCWYAVRKGKKHNWNGARDQTTIWQIDNNSSFGGNGEEATGHSTQKPIECMARPIANNSKPGDMVYDPFCGSGTTLIACKQSGRRCAAVEIDPRYADVIIYRWEKLSGRKAERANAK